MHKNQVNLKIIKILNKIIDNQQKCIIEVRCQYVIMSNINMINLSILNTNQRM